MKQHTVPQNIMSVEFKIIGDLSIKQFVYVCIAGGAAFIIYLLGLPSILKIPLIVIVVVIGLAVALGKVNERPFDQWISSFITAVLLPTQRVWKKTSEPPFYLLDDTQPQVETPKKTTDEGYSKVINYIHSRNLPTDELRQTNTKLDIEEIKFLTNVDKMLSTPLSKPSVDDLLLSTKPSNPMPNTQNVAINTSPINPINPINPNNPTPTMPASPPVTQRIVTDNALSNNNISQTNSPIFDPREDQTNVVNAAVTNSVTIQDPPIKQEAQSDKIDNVLDNQVQKSMTITPNQNISLDDLTAANLNDNQLSSTPAAISDQVNLVQAQVPDINNVPAPGSNDEPNVYDLTAPVVDEHKVEETDTNANTFTIEPDSIVKLDDLKGLSTSTVDSLDNALKSIDVPLENTPAQQINPPAIQSSNPVSATPTPPVVNPNDALEKLEEENRLLREQIELIRNRENAMGTMQQPITSNIHPIQTSVESQAQPQLTADSQLIGHMPDFTRYPNIICGVVVDSNEKYCENVVVIIKDKSHRIMRAMKTNIVGQFYSRNPLINGMYTIEANKEGLVFETASVELNGNSVLPVVMRPKKFNISGGAGNLLS